MKYIFSLIIAIACLSSCSDKDTFDEIKILTPDEFERLFPSHEMGKQYTETFYCRTFVGDDINPSYDFYPLYIGVENNVPIKADNMWVVASTFFNTAPPIDLVYQVYNIDETSSTFQTIMPTTTIGKYLVADYSFTYEDCKYNPNHTAERVGDWRVVTGVKQQYQYNEKIYTRINIIK